MPSGHSLEGLRSLGPALAWTAAISGLFLALMLSLYRRMDIPIHHLTRDPATLTNTPSYFGLLSHIGVLLWFAAAVLCLFSAFLCGRRPSAQRFHSFHYASGLLTLILTLDDLFLLHEEVIPYYLGVNEGTILGAYVLVVLGYLLRFRGLITEGGALLFGLALFFFGLSVVLDIIPALLFDSGATVEDVPIPLLNYYLFFEDGAKFVGIVAWLVYFARFCTHLLQSGAGERNPSGQLHAYHRALCSAAAPYSCPAVASSVLSSL